MNYLLRLRMSIGSYVYVVGENQALEFVFESENQVNQIKLR